MARQETVQITCELDANPRDVVFSWKFNNTVEAVDIPFELISTEAVRSIVSYTPSSEIDYGTLLCSGTNDQGTQAEPCVFHVVPAGESTAPTRRPLLFQPYLNYPRYRSWTPRRPPPVDGFVVPVARSTGNIWAFLPFLRNLFSPTAGERLRHEYLFIFGKFWRLFRVFRCFLDLRTFINIIRVGFIFYSWVNGIIKYIVNENARRNLFEL